VVTHINLIQNWFEELKAVRVRAFVDHVML